MFRRPSSSKREPASGFTECAGAVGRFFRGHAPLLRKAVGRIFLYARKAASKATKPLLPDLGGGPLWGRGDDLPLAVGCA